MTLAQVRAFAHENPKELRRFLLFATVGALGSITDIGVLNILVKFAGFGLVPAKALGFVSAVIQNFFLNRRWTFPESQERKTGNQLFMFATVSLVGLGLNMLVFLVTHTLLEPTWHRFIDNPELAYTVSYNFATLFAIGVVLFWNFSANRFWTYRNL